MSEKSSTEGVAREPVRLAVLGSFTMTPLCRSLSRKGRDLGIPVEVYEAPYGRYREDILDSGSGLYGADPEATILAIDVRSVLGELLHSPHSASVEERVARKDRFLNEVRTLIEQFRKRNSGLLLIHNLQRPFRTTSGVADGRDEYGIREMVDEINLGLLRTAKTFDGAHCVDFDGFMGWIGKREGCSEKFRYLGDLLIADSALPSLCEHYFAYLKPLRRLNRKCLVLDLDNTLWGGIVGEDGFEGIALGDTAPGNSYREFQEAILGLSRRGIALAVNSRNNYDDAMKVIREHPGMVLKEKDFAAIRINWENKARNLVEIANEMNIGLDSMVFCDDDPANRDLVREALPEVLTVEMPEDPSLYVRTLLGLTDFDALGLTSEDLKRKDLYYQERRRRETASEFDDLSGYLNHLDMRVTVREADSFSIPRASQLTQRTNQFNMTTRRYSEPEIRRFCESEDWLVLIVDLTDRFGENPGAGLAVIDRSDKKNWRLDVFLMSCRVLGRGVEEAFVAEVVRRAKMAGAVFLTGEVFFTRKNPPAREFYGKCGFERTKAGDEETAWRLDVWNASPAVPGWIEMTGQETIPQRR